jgi:hypothetical protein
VNPKLQVTAEAVADGY